MPIIIIHTNGYSYQTNFSQDRLERIKIIVEKNFDKFLIHQL